MNRALPAWAEQALDSFAPLPACGEAAPDPDLLRQHQLFCEKIRGRWTELEVDFCPSISKLTAYGKKIVLEEAIYVGRYQGSDHFSQLREAKTELEKLNTEITTYLERVSGLMKQRDQLKTDFELSDSLPSVFDAIQSAANRYPEWVFVANKEVSAFLQQRCQTRPKPSMLDVIECFTELSSEKVFSDDDPVICASQKSDADHIKAMLQAMSDLCGCGYERFGISENFKITDKAVAALVSVLFDLDDYGVSEDTVKKRRQAFEKQKRR